MSAGEATTGAAVGTDANATCEMALAGAASFTAGAATGAAGAATANVFG